jgi:TAT (twin-arginine translocation) pathway signal sequence
MDRRTFLKNAAGAGALAATGGLAAPAIGSHSDMFFRLMDFSEDRPFATITVSTSTNKAPSAFESRPIISASNGFSRKIKIEVIEESI